MCNQERNSTHTGRLAKGISQHASKRRLSAERSIRTTGSCFHRNPESGRTPPPQTIIVRYAGQGQPLFKTYAATVSQRISHRDAGIFSSKATPKFVLTSSRIWRVQVTWPRIAYRTSGCRMTPTASPGTTFFRELNSPNVSESAKTLAGWRVFSSGDSVSNVEENGRRPLTSSKVKDSFSSRTLGPLPSHEILMSS